MVHSGQMGNIVRGSFEPRRCVQQRARRHGKCRHSRQLWQCGICNLQNLKNPVGFESHPLRHQ
jgi:hypothetical protein